MAKFFTGKDQAINDDIDCNYINVLIIICMK